MFDIILIILIVVLLVICLILYGKIKDLEWAALQLAERGQQHHGWLTELEYDRGRPFRDRPKWPEGVKVSNATAEELADAADEDD